MNLALGKVFAGGVCALGLLGATVAPRFAPAQGAGTPAEAVQLRDMIKAMGYETRDLTTTPGKEKFEFTISKDDLDIPIAVEVSPSKRYIWFTVFLGELKDIKDFPSRTEKLLRRNFDIQPCQFYVTNSDRLMLGLAAENRGIDPPLLRKSFEKVAEDVASSKPTWGGENARSLPRQR